MEKVGGKLCLADATRQATPQLVGADPLTSKEPGFNKAWRP